MTSFQNSCKGYDVFVFRKIDVLRATAEDISSQTGNEVHWSGSFRSDSGISVTDLHRSCFRHQSHVASLSGSFAGAGSAV